MLVINDFLDGIHKSCVSGKPVQFNGRKVIIAKINKLNVSNITKYLVELSDESLIEITIRDRGE